LQALSHTSASRVAAPGRTQQDLAPGQPQRSEPSMRRPLLRKLATPLVAALALACGERDAAAPAAAAPQASNGKPERGDWLVLHQLSDPENLNPLTSTDYGSQQVHAWIYPPLVTIDPETRQQRPVIAAALPEISADHLSFTYRLRPGVTFSDGKALTSRDVVFTLKAILHPGVNAPVQRQLYASVADVEALDELSVRIRCREVYFRNPWTLGGIQPIPRHYYDPEDLLGEISIPELLDWDSLAQARREKAERFARQFNEGFQRNPVGPGAYALVDPKRDWVTGERIVLTHRDDFWAPGDSDLGDAWVDRIVFRIINDSSAALVALKARQLDVLETPTFTPIQYLRETNSAKFKRQTGKYAYDGALYYYIGWNQARPIFQDKRVRQAFSHMVDKKNLVEKVMFGLAHPIEGPVSPLREEYNQDLEPWPFDPERARALLADAGWSDTDGDGVLDREIDGKRVPLRFEIVTNAGNETREKVGLVVIDEFKRHGVDVRLRTLDWSIMLEKVKRFDYDAVILGWSGSNVIPPDNYQIWHSSQAVENGSNHVGFRNAEADDLLERYRVEFDAARRKQLYHRFQEIVYDEQPYTFLFSPKELNAWDLRFHGVTWYEGVGANANEWWVPADARLHP
jgi:peptide/nickel transport system substrate-binding protein